MKAVRLGCAILATMGALFWLCSEPFGSHNTLSWRTAQAIDAAEANPTPQNKALVEEGRRADEENYLRQKRYEDFIDLLLVTPSVAGIWFLWWHFGRRPRQSPASN